MTGLEIPDKYFFARGIFVCVSPKDAKQIALGTEKDFVDEFIGWEPEVGK
jgi:hypothetical protein